MGPSSWPRARAAPLGRRLAERGGARLLGTARAVQPPYPKHCTMTPFERQWDRLTPKERTAIAKENLPLDRQDWAALSMDEKRKRTTLGPPASQPAGRR